MSAIPSTIQNIFDLGILPGGGNLSAQRSYDSRPSAGVCLNCISKINGIEISLTNPAKGGFTVATEEKMGVEGGILMEALARNSLLIQQKKAEFNAISPNMGSACTIAARHAALKEDREFLRAISNKAHHTALFILDLEVKEGDTSSSDGSREVVRQKISSDHIQKVLISKKIMDEMDDPRFIIVESVPMVINYCYKDESNEPQIIRGIGPIEMPNYLDSLTRLATESAKREPLSKKPIYTHMTRL